MAMRFDDNLDFRSDVDLSDRDAIAVIHDCRPLSDVVHVFGVLDFTTAAQLEQALSRAVRIGKPIVADLTECRFMDAAAVGVLLRARNALDGLFTVRATDGSIVSRVLRIVGLNELIQA